MRYYIADCHFFHEKLLKYMDGRGFETMEEMHEYMISQWNSRVRKNDEVVILGDFSWGRAEETQEILKRLNGKLSLIRGNHDRYLDDRRFDLKRFWWIEDYKEMNDEGRKVILSHYPIVCYNFQYRRDEDGNPIAYMLHGHVHRTQDQDFLDEYARMISTKTHINIGTGEEESIPFNLINCFCQYSDYVPLTLDEWIEVDRKRKAGELVFPEPEIGPFPDAKKDGNQSAADDDYDDEEEYVPLNLVF